MKTYAFKNDIPSELFMIYDTLEDMYCSSIFTRVGHAKTSLRTFQEGERYYIVRLLVTGVEKYDGK